NDYGQAIAFREGLRRELEPLGQWPPSLANALAAAYVNRGVAYDAQGRLGEAVNDYGQAIELIYSLVFQAHFSPAIPDLAMVFFNLLLLCHNQPEIGRKHLPAGLQRAREFLVKLPQVVNIEDLPDSWRKKLTDLEGLIEHITKGGKG
ncbi:MAG: tetratricopeptide repeat protein, partial [Thermodesulfobacteriota bacterium]